MMRTLKAALIIGLFLFCTGIFTACKKDKNNQQNNNNNNNNNQPPTEYKYSEKQVSFLSDTFHLQGTLFVPDRQGTAPALIIVAGSGNINRYGQIPNDTAALPAIYRNWARYFAKKGYVVLCYDKRYITYPKINILKFSENDQIKDIESAADFLSLQSNVDPLSVSLIGHSEGGNIVTVSATHKTYIRKVVVINSPDFPIDTLFVTQLKNSGAYSDSQIKQVQDAFVMIRNGSFPPNGQIFGAGKDYWTQWIDYSTHADSIAGKVARAVLVMQAEEDPNYPDSLLDRNIAEWRAGASEHTNITFKTVPGDNHMLLNANTQAEDESALQTMADFLK